MEPEHGARPRRLRRDRHLPDRRAARPRAPSSEIEGVTIHRYEPRRAGERAIDYALEYLAALRSIRRLARRLGARAPFDLVHACSPPDFLLLAALGLRRRGARFVFDHHDLTPELYLTRFGGGPAAPGRPCSPSRSPSAAPTSSCRSTTPTGGSRSSEVAGTPPTSSSSGPGPDLTRFRAAATPDPSLKRGKRYLLSYVGVMGPQDGVDHALRALAELQRCCATDWHAIFMGDGDVIDEMRTAGGRARAR